MAVRSGDKPTGLFDKYVKLRRWIIGAMITLIWLHSVVIERYKRIKRGLNNILKR
jgi:hypothetical protein